MTTDIRPDLVVACAASPDCYHKACLDCLSPMRSSSTNKDEPPGTRTLQRAQTCSTCPWGTVRLLPSDLTDQRHHIMSDDEMMHIWETNAGVWEWLMQRRYRLGLVQEATA